jgi:hypothetical protein
MRQLIVNVDDGGPTPGVSKGILGADREGIVTGASLMRKSSQPIGSKRDDRSAPGCANYFVQGGL